MRNDAAYSVLLSASRRALHVPGASSTMMVRRLTPTSAPCGVFDANLPDVRAAPYVQGTSRSRDFAGSRRPPDVIYGNIQAKATFPGPVHAQPGRHAPQCFGKRSGCASVHDASRLHGALVHRHDPAQKIGADLRKPDAEVRSEGARGHIGERLKVGRSEPDGRRDRSRGRDRGRRRRRRRYTHFV